MAENVRRLIVTTLAILVVATVGCKPAAPPKVAYSDAAFRTEFYKHAQIAKDALDSPFSDDKIWDSYDRMEAMIKEGGEGALTILIDVVKNEPDLMAAAEAVMLMDKCPDPRSVEAIVYRTRKLPMSGVVKEQMFGSTAAGVLGNKAGRRQLGSHKEAVRKLALDSLEDGPLRQTMAAEILGRMPSKDDVPALVKMMKRKEPTKKGTKPSPYYRSAAAKALLRIGTPEAIEAVREQLKHTYSDEMEKGTWREVEDQLKQLDSKK